jgi:hypothetical protein
MAVQALSSYGHNPAAPGPQDVALTPENGKIAKLLKLEEITGLPSDVARLVASYVLPNPFGAEAWKRYYGVDVGLEPELPSEFYEWWISPDVIKPHKLNCDTHLPPVLRPQYVRKAALNTPLTLNTLEYLAQHPKEGPQSRYISDSDSEALQQHGDTRAGSACWLVMRKGVFARNQSYVQQKECIQKLNTNGAGYDKMPSALDLATIVFATYVLTGGDRYLGDCTGKESWKTFSRCKESIQSGKDSYSLVVGRFAPGGLDVADDNSYVHVRSGVAALRKF